LDAEQTTGSVALEINLFEARNTRISSRQDLWLDGRIPSNPNGGSPMTNDSIPKTTPWGEPQTTEILAPGIVLFTTASHGGIWLSPERNAQVPLKLKRGSFCGNGLAGWYEEDCDAAIVYQVFDLAR
jgi:hypothetical protein